MSFDLVLCIESFHCIGSIQHLLCGVRSVMDDGGSFIIADIFDKNEGEKARLENLMKDYFKIEKKEVITFNVKHAMSLDKPRIEKIITTSTEIPSVRKMLRNFLASAEGSNTYNELGKTKDYICYVLRPIAPADAGHQVVRGKPRYHESQSEEGYNCGSVSSQQQS